MFKRVSSLAPQGLMQAAVLAASPALAAALTRLLGGLHAEKAAPGVDALLLRLYRPILFRGLAAANAAVRRNALQLLLAAFPLQARRLLISLALAVTECRRQPGAKQGSGLKDLETGLWLTSPLQARRLPSSHSHMLHA